MSKTRACLSVCAFLAVLCCSRDGLANSEAQVVTFKLVDFFRLNSQQAWALVRNKSDKTILFWTSDGGENWNSAAAPFTLQRIFFSDAENGWATAVERYGEKFRSVCLRTSDSGRTWSKLSYIANSGTATGIAFDTIDHGWIVGGEESGMAFVYETEDGGEHWSKLAWEAKPASTLGGVRLQDGTAFTWSAGADGSGIFRLRPGLSPQWITDLETMNFAFVSGDSILSAGNLRVYLKTSADDDWDEVLQAKDKTFWDMRFADAQSGCVVGGEIYCTADGGRSWELRQMPRNAEGENEFFYRFYLLDNLHGWADSDDSIFETNDGAHTWSKVDFVGSDGKPLTHTRRIN
jgi:photosystem II stability/assembly factor-like uncharacterized protein